MNATPNVTALQTALVRRAQRGDQDAFATLCRLHRDHAVRRCRALTRNAEDAEDAVQEALIIVQRRLPHLRHDTDFRAYLVTVARNVAVTRHRRRALTVVGDEDAADRVAAPEHERPDELLLRRERRERLLALTGALPERQRLALVQSAVSGVSYAEVGERLGLNENAVAQLVFRARAAVRAGMDAA